MTALNHLKAAAHDNWAADGWLLLPEFLDQSSLAALRDEADQLMQQRDLFVQRGAVPISPARRDRLDPVIDLSPLFADLARSPIVLDAVSEVLGAEARLMKDKFIAKPPGDRGYGAHQDGAYWPGLGLDLSRFLTAVFHLDDAPADAGPFQCAPGAHRRLLTDPDRISDLDESEVGPFTTVEAAAGDLLLVHAFTPHRSEPNRSTRMRRTLMFVYGVDPRPDLYEIYGRYRRG